MGGAGGFSAPTGSSPAGVIPDATATGMAGAMDQALAGGAPKPKAEQKAEPKPKPKPDAKSKGGKYKGADRKKPAKAVGVGDEAAAGEGTDD